MLNRKFFFEYARSRLFDGKLTQKQVDGLNSIVDTWDGEYAKMDDRWLAYMLATAHHETDRKMQPIREYGGNAYYMRMYDVTGDRPKLAKSMGNTQPGDGKRYYGRGFVQLTWMDNYAWAAKEFGVDFVNNPDLALEPRYAMKIMFVGMQKGRYTGKKLADYFAADKEDWVNARRIINGTDKANLIATYAKSYYAAISHTV